MARSRRRSFGLRSNSRRRARRNLWKEGKTSSFTVKKAPRHRAAALKGWKKRGSKKAAASTVVVVQAPKAQPKKRKKASGGKRRKPKAHSAKRSGGKKRKSVKRNARRSRRVVIRLNRRRRRSAPRRNRGHRKAHRRNRRSHRKMHRNGRRSHRRNRRSRRNGYAGLLMTGLGVAAGLGGAAYLGSKLVDYLSKPGADGKSMIPPSLIEYAPALLTAAGAGALYMAAKKFGGAKIAPHLNTLLAGGIAASVIQLALHVKDSKGVSIASKLGLTPASTVVASPSDPSKPVSGYGVFGLNGYTDVSGLGGYGVFGLGNNVALPNGGALAVDGVVSLPGGPLAVEGASFGGYLGTTLSDSVVGTGFPSSGPASNPFAPGLREGQRGTLNEAHAAEVADAGSLSGNIFS